MPPHAPPALVTEADSATAQALEKLADVQQWLLEQQGALPDAPGSSANLDQFLDRIDAFWHATVELDGTTTTRRDAFTRQLAGAARQQAALLASDGLLSPSDLDLVLAATTPDRLPVASTIRASEWRPTDAALTGVLVLQDDTMPGAVLLYARRTGWHVFDSIDDARTYISETEATSEWLEASLGKRPFDTFADGLIRQYTDGIALAWRGLGDRDLPAPMDAVIDALWLHPLIDIHGMLSWRNAMADTAYVMAAGDDIAPGGVTGDFAGDALAHRIRRSLPPSVLKSLSGALSTRVRTLVRTPVLRRNLRHADTLFDKRYVARGVGASPGAEPPDGIFTIRNARYVRQDGQFYAVRFDAGTQRWRLAREGAPDANFTGPLIERLPDGRWQFSRAGLAGGGGTGKGPHYVSPADWEIYRPYLSETIGDFYVTEYILLRQRLGRALGAREELVFNALGMRRGAAEAPHVAPEELEIFQVHVDGIRALRSHRVSGYGTWRPEPDALVAAQRQAYLPELPTQVTDEAIMHFLASAMPQVAGFSPTEVRLLIAQLQWRAGGANALRIFTTLGRRPLPNETLAQVTPEELTHWTGALNHVRALRTADPTLADLPGPSRAPFATPPQAPRLDLIPEREWPDVAYYYGTPYELERFRHAQIVPLSASRPAQSPVQGIPLLSLAPETPLSQAAGVPDAWLPRTPLSIATQSAPTTPVGQAAGAWIRIDLRAMRRLPPASNPLLSPLPYQLFRQVTEHGSTLVLRRIVPFGTQGWWNPAIFIEPGQFTVHFWPTR